MVQFAKKVFQFVKKSLQLAEIMILFAKIGNYLTSLHFEQKSHEKMPHFYQPLAI
jgi:hypothetical protein